MADKPHVYYRNEAEGNIDFKPPARGGSDEIEKKEKDYTTKRKDFIRSRDSFFAQRLLRNSTRNNNLAVPANIEYIEIHFHNTFDSSIFETKYRINFGLSATAYWDFNSIGLFAVVDVALFNSFIQEIEKFISTEYHIGKVSYNSDIKYIKEFYFHSTNKIIKYSKLNPQIIVNIIDNIELFNDFILPIEVFLLDYLKKKNITSFYNKEYNKLEIFNIDEDCINEIANNFDIIQSINSYAAGVVRPSLLNLAEKSFGFVITNENENLPIIGIIDTGISNQTPLSKLILNESREFDLTNTSPFTDVLDHGTAVAALATLGDRLFPSHIGSFEADAKLLSIKILDKKKDFIPEAEVVRLIKEANTKYGVQIFTLTIAYTEPKKYNETISEYAYALDVLSYELNILIFIAIGNSTNLNNYDGKKFVNVSYPDHFDTEESNLFIPAESMNNITIGAASGNFENNRQVSFSPDSIFPAIYTRTHNINWSHSTLNWTKINKSLFKPDLCHYAGDYDDKLDHEPAGLKIMSSQPGIFFNKNVGTSYAVPLAANLAAKLLRKYPTLSSNMQTIKALLLNGSFSEKIDENFSALKNISLKSIYGNGIPNTEAVLQSDENKVTFILQDTITPQKLKSYILKLPQYLLNVERENGVLQVEATLCFNFKPTKNNQLAYCPIHITFGIFRNLPLEEFELEKDGSLKLNHKGKPIPLGINSNKSSNYVFAESWAQDYYYKAKILSNAQKVVFNISKKVLIAENCTLKIAVNAVLHKLISPTIKESFNVDYPFSIVFSIKENPVRKVNKNMLYDELVGLNNAEPISIIESDLEAEGEN